MFWCLQSSLKATPWLSLWVVFSRGSQAWFSHSNFAPPAVAGSISIWINLWFWENWKDGKPIENQKLRDPERMETYRKSYRKSMKVMDFNPFQVISVVHLPLGLVLVMGAIPRLSGRSALSYGENLPLRWTGVSWWGVGSFSIQWLGVVRSYGYLSIFPNSQHKMGSTCWGKALGPRSIGWWSFSLFEYCHFRGYLIFRPHSEGKTD